jgi:hypothetical protein
LPVAGFNGLNLAPTKQPIGLLTGL